jgi:hypothetical protein
MLSVSSKPTDSFKLAKGAPPLIHASNTQNAPAVDDNRGRTLRHRHFQLLDPLHVRQKVLAGIRDSCDT